MKENKNRLTDEEILMLEQIKAEDEAKERGELTLDEQAAAYLADSDDD